MANGVAPRLLDGAARSQRCQAILRLLPRRPLLCLRRKDLRPRPNRLPLRPLLLLRPNRQKSGSGGRDVFAILPAPIRIRDSSESRLLPLRLHRRQSRRNIQDSESRRRPPVPFAKAVAQPPPPPCIVLYTAHWEFNSCASYQCRRYEADTACGMTSSREYPERPLFGVGGVVIQNERALLIRRGSEPLRGEWSIPGGMLELGESLQQGVARELLEETGFRVRVLDVIEVFDRIYGSSDQDKGIVPADGPANRRPRFHYVIIDYLCEVVEGNLRAGGDVTDARFASEQELSQFGLTETASRVLQKAFAMYRARRAAG